MGLVGTFHLAHLWLWAIIQTLEDDRQGASEMGPPVCCKDTREKTWQC